MKETWECSVGNWVFLFLSKQRWLRVTELQVAAPESGKWKFNRLFYFYFSQSKYGVVSYVSHRRMYIMPVCTCAVVYVFLP